MTNPEQKKALAINASNSTHECVHMKMLIQHQLVFKDKRVLFPRAFPVTVSEAKQFSYIFL